MYLEAVLKLFADKVEDDGVYAGVDCYKVDTQVIQDQQETEKPPKKKGFVMISFIENQQR